jgi:hypothetical protein
MHILTLITHYTLKLYESKTHSKKASGAVWTLYYDIPTDLDRVINE